MAATSRQKHGDSDRVRQCAVTREQRPQKDLIRFVAGPDGTVVPDLAERLPGRGVWVMCRREQIDEAVRRKAFARSLKQPVTAPPDLGERVADLLRRRALEALALANKAGLVVAGTAKIEAEIAAGGVATLVHASDAAPDGRRKLDRAFLRGFAQTERAPRIIDAFTGAELSLAIGRPNVVHAAIRNGGMRSRFLKDTERFERYCGGWAPDTDA